MTARPGQDVADLIRARHARDRLVAGVQVLPTEGRRTHHDPSASTPVSTP
ncbi:hypothetical protein ACFUJR_16030 [Streptomyces sp. NPDC057271]